MARKSDAELAARVAAGDETAFTAIVMRHRAHLLHHCLAVLHDQRAEDAVQQTFVRALQALQAGTEVRQLRPWLHRIAHNVALSELSARGADHAELDEDWEDCGRSEEYDRRATLRQALSAVAALPERQRAALVRSAAGDSPATIARDLGLSTVAARQLLHRARMSVRAAVRVICPPPLLWLSKRMTAFLEGAPRGAGVPAGAAPVVAKIAVALVATATVAAPVTVIHGAFTHAPPRRPRHPVAARSPAASPNPQAEVPAVARSASPRPASPAANPAPVADRQPRTQTSMPVRATVAASASSPDSAPVGAGGSSGYSSAVAAAASGSPGSAGTGSSTSGMGPISSATASSPTQPATSGDSASTTTASSQTSGTGSGPAGGSTDTSATNAGSATPSSP